MTMILLPVEFRDIEPLVFEYFNLIELITIYKKISILSKKHHENIHNSIMREFFIFFEKYKNKTLDTKMIKSTNTGNLYLFKYLEHFNNGKVSYDKIFPECCIINPEYYSNRELFNKRAIILRYIWCKIYKLTDINNLYQIFNSTVKHIINKNYSVYTMEIFQPLDDYLIKKFLIKLSYNLRNKCIKTNNTEYYEYVLAYLNEEERQRNIINIRQIIFYDKVDILKIIFKYNLIKENIEDLYNNIKLDCPKIIIYLYSKLIETHKPTIFQILKYKTALLFNFK